MDKDVAHIYSGTLHACVLGHFSRVQLCATLWTAACQAPLSVGFSRHVALVINTVGDLRERESIFFILKSV